MLNNFHIAISGKSGCGNSTVSSLCAEKLGFRLVNFTFRQLAEEKGLSFQELRDLAEKSDDIDRELDRRQVEMARKSSSVLASRLAIWMMPDADLKVYLEASAEVRSGRIGQREGGTAEEKLAETQERDAKDRKRYQRIYDIDNDEYGFADLVIDTEKYGPEAIADMIVEHALQAGAQKAII